MQQWDSVLHAPPPSSHMEHSQETFRQPLLLPCQNPLDIPHEMHMLQQRLFDCESCLAHATHMSTQYITERIELVRTNNDLQNKVRDMRTKFKEASERRRLRDARQYYTISNMRKEIAALQLERETLQEDALAKLDMVPKALYEVATRDKEAILTTCIELRQDNAQLLRAHQILQQQVEDRKKESCGGDGRGDNSSEQTLKQHGGPRDVNTTCITLSDSISSKDDDSVVALHAKIKALNKAMNAAACKASTARKALQTQVAELEYTLTILRQDLKKATTAVVATETPSVSPSKQQHPKNRSPITKLVGPRGSITHEPPTSSSSSTLVAPVHKKITCVPMYTSVASTSVADNTSVNQPAFSLDSSTTQPSSDVVVIREDTSYIRDTARWRCAATIVRKMMDDFTNFRALYEDKPNTEFHIHKRQRVSVKDDVTSSSASSSEMQHETSTTDDRKLLECIHHLHTRMDIQRQAYAKEKALFNNGLRFYLLLMTQYVPTCAKEHQTMLQSCIEQLEEAVLKGESISAIPPTDHSLTIAEPD